MGLINLTTNLKSLKYGSDRQGGGNSGQPFIKQSIPDGQAPFINTGVGFIDQVINGTELVVSSAGRDVLRLGKFFTTTPGLLFIAKQNVLSQTNVRTQANQAASPDIIINGGPYTPTNTLAQIAGSAIGSHFFKQGLSPTGYRVPKYGDNDTIIHVTETNTNRLLLLKDSKITNSISVNPSTGISPFGTEILRYTGGPGSTLGVGSTAIDFAVGTRTGINNPLYKNNTSNIPIANTFYGSLTPGSLTANPALSISQQEVYKNQPVINLVDFRDRLREGIVKSSLLSISPSYSRENIENRVYLGNPGKRDKNIISYTAGLGTSLDKVNAKPLYSSRLVAQEEVNDLVKFRIEAINNDDPGEGVFIHFRAFLDSFSDNYSAAWTPIQYIGRGEKFYTYDTFDRTINLSWTVAAQSKEELIPMYQKLNFLASNLMPDYNNQGYMRGPLVRLTVGGYLYSQPGFITNLTYDIPQEATWEIGINDVGGSDPSVKELPHMIKVSTFTFTPIHNFVPRKQINEYSGSLGVIGGVSKFGDQRFIALSTGDNNNYDVNPIPLLGDPNDEFDLTPLQGL